MSKQYRAILIGAIVARKRYRATLFVAIPEMSGRVFVVGRQLKANGTKPCQQTKPTCKATKLSRVCNSMPG
jgi:hypothetical protein